MAKKFLPNYVGKKYRACSQTIDFAKLVYSDTSFNGYVVLAIKTSRTFKEIPVPITQLPTFVKKMFIYHNADYYISSNIFSTTKRSSDTLFALNAIVLDIACHQKRPLSDESTSGNVTVIDMDGHDEDNYIRELSPRIEVLIWRLQNDAFLDADFPTPNFIVYKGLGVHLWWCTVPAYAKFFGNNFSDVEHHFVSRIKEFLAEFPSEFRDFSVDPVASSNVAGYFRLPGSINTHCGKEVEPIFLHEQRLDLKMFRDQFLPMSTRCKRMGNLNPRFHTPIKSDLVGAMTARLTALEKLRDLRSAPIGDETRNNVCLPFYVNLTASSLSPRAPLS